MGLEGVDEKLARMVLDANLDQATERRRVREAFKEVQLGIDHCLLKEQYTGLNIKESYAVNSRGIEIFSKSWIPEDYSKMKAIVCFFPAYGDTCTFIFEGVAKKLASSGYGVFALDYPGFGLSEGLHGFIPDFDRLVDDVVEHFTKIKENPEFRTLPSFLFGQSMGGAIALKVHFKQPSQWSGAVLVAPMCKLSEVLVPPWPLKQLLIGLSNILPKQKLVPQDDVVELQFKDVKKRNLLPYDVIVYKDKPRLKTAVEMLRATQAIELRLEEVSLPLLILHGEADAITDPSASKLLFERARSADKKLCLYKDARHFLLEGEDDDTILAVLAVIVSWLDHRAAAANITAAIS